MKPGTTIVTLVDAYFEDVELIPAGCPGALVTGQEDAPKENPGYYVVRLDQESGGELIELCYHKSEFQITE